MAHSLMRIVTAVLLAGVAAVVGGPAAAQNHDYYNPPPDGLLGAVERRHLVPGIQKMSQRIDRWYAWDEFNFVLGEFPNHPRALDLMVQLCQTWRDTGSGPSPRKHCKLDEYFEKAIAINPKVSSTYVVLGIYHLRFDRPKAAVDTFKKALEIDPGSMNAHYNLGLAYFDLKDYALSNEHAQRAYALGAPLPGLREKLRKAGKWNPSAVPPALAPPLSSAEPNKPASEK